MVETIEREVTKLPDLKVQPTVYDDFKAKREKLTAALRDNTDRQTFGALRRGNDVCFVGLADELL